MSQGKHEIEVLYVPLKQWHCSWTLHTVAALRQHQQKTRTKRHQKDAISTHLSHNLVNRHQKWLKGCISSASCPLRTAVDGGKTGQEEGGGRKGSCTLLMEIASNKVKPTSTKCLVPKRWFLTLAMIKVSAFFLQFLSLFLDIVQKWVESKCLCEDVLPGSF